MDVPTLIRNVQRTFGDDNQVFITEADVMDWVNDGQMEIVRETGCLVATVTPAASAFPYTLPADFIRVARVRYGTYSLDLIRLEDLEAKKFDLTSKDTPFFYYLKNDTICLFPDPTDSDATVVTFEYLKTPTVITTTAGLLTVPVHFHADLILWCVMKAHERNENYRAMELALQRFKNNLSVRVDDTDNADETYPVIRDDPWAMGWV